MQLQEHITELDNESKEMAQLIYRQSRKIDRVIDTNNQLIELICSKYNLDLENVDLNIIKKAMSSPEPS